MAVSILLPGGTKMELTQVAGQPFKDALVEHVDKSIERTQESPGETLGRFGEDIVWIKKRMGV